MFRRTFRRGVFRRSGAGSGVQAPEVDSKFSGPIQARAFRPSGASNSGAQAHTLTAKGRPVPDPRPGPEARPSGRFTLPRASQARMYEAASPRFFSEVPPASLRCGSGGGRSQLRQCSSQSLVGGRGRVRDNPSSPSSRTSHPPQHPQPLDSQLCGGMLRNVCRGLGVRSWTCKCCQIARKPCGSLKMATMQRLP